MNLRYGLHLAIAQFVLSHPTYRLLVYAKTKHNHKTRIQSTCLCQGSPQAPPGTLIEGHTDATGKAAMNLALSDRRAETVALALAEYFDIPPENMVIQGYGEEELRIDTQANEPRNRRVAVRIITPLLQVAN